MRHEDRLRELLHDEASHHVPSGDGLARIQDRLRRRRRSRWLLLPGAAAVTGAAVAAAFVLGGGGPGTTLTQDPATHGPSPTPSGAPTVTGGGLDHAFENPALWPFTSAQEIAAWRTTYPYADDKSALVQHYLQDVLGVTGAVLTKPCESCDVVDITVNAHKVGTAALERFFLDGAQVYTISTIGGTDLRVTSPTQGEAVSSPTTVTGRITGVDEHVNLALVSQAGTTVTSGGAQAGSAVPWTAQLTWSDTGWTHAGLVARTFSAKDGTLDRLTVVPVTRGSGTTGASFAGVRNGRVDLFDGTTGAFLKHLTYPPSGFADTRAAFRQGDLIWIRQAVTGCRSAVYELHQGHALTLSSSGTYDFADVRVSPDGRTVAYLRRPCRSSAFEVVVRGMSNWQQPAGSRMPALYDVNNDGEALLVDAGTTYLGSSTGRVRLDPGAHCWLSAGTVAETGVSQVWRSCGGAFALTTFRADGSVSSSGEPAFDMVNDLSRDTQGYLVVGRASPSSPVGVYRMAGTQWTELVKDGSVASASW